MGLPATMIRNKEILKFFWLFMLLDIFYFPSLAMFMTDENFIPKIQCDIQELHANFETILETQPQYINLQSESYMYAEANGIYQLIPYYQKWNPEISKLDFKSSRFIIHKHMISGQWQLTEFNYPWSKNLKAFPLSEEQEKNALLKNVFSKQKIENSNKVIHYQKVTIESLEKEINFFKISLKQEIQKAIEMNSEKEKFLMEKQNEIKDLNFTKKELEKKLKKNSNQFIEKENQVNVLENKLFEKKKKIHELKKKYFILQKNCEKFENEKLKLEKILDSKKNNQSNNQIFEKKEKG